MTFTHFRLVVRGSVRAMDDAARTTANGTPESAAAHSDPAVATGRDTAGDTAGDTATDAATDAVTDAWTRRRSSFGAVARAYAEHRPTYPDDAVTWVLEPIRLRHPVRVLDLGAGTGRLSEALREAEVDVIAVEPDHEMRTVMLERVYGVAALAGSAEDIPLPDARVDAVVCGQSFHWFDADAAHPEIARVLKPGGVLAGLWNGPDEQVPWVADFLRLSYRPAPEESDPDAWPGGRVGQHPAFTDIESKQFTHVQRRTADSLVETVATHSATIVLPDDEREALLEETRAFLRSRPETRDGEFDLPLHTHVIRAIRR